MPTSAIARMKTTERNKARKAVLAEVDMAAQALGYKDHAHLLAEMKKHNKGRERPPAPAPRAPAPAANAAGAAGGGGQDSPTERERKLERQLARLQDERRKHVLDKNALQKRERRLRSAQDAREAEFQLRLAAVQSGIANEENVDFAIQLLRRKLTGMKPRDLEGFDEKQFFQDLRGQRPYLFGETVLPAGGSSGETDPKGAPPPKVPAGAGSAGGGGNKDSKNGMTMSRQEYEATLRSMGLTVPGHGAPS
jgi:hypothetical protein